MSSIISLPDGPRIAIIEESAALPTVSIWFPCGTWHDPAEYDGLAHLIEHLSFYGPEGDQRAFAIWLESAGAIFNAYTQDMATMFLARAPQETFAQVLESQAALAYRPSCYPEAIIARELAVIQEEQRRGVSLEEHLLKAAMRRIHPRLSARESTQACTPTSAIVNSYRRRMYQPAASYVVILHPDGRAARRLAEEVFGSISEPAEDLPEREAGQASPAFSPASVRMEHNGKGYGSSVGFRWKASGAEDLARFNILHRMLALGMASRLHGELVFRRGLVYNISARIRFSPEASSYALSASSSAPELPCAFNEALAQHANELKLGRFDTSELERARRRYITYLYLLQENKLKLSEFLGERLLLDGKLDDLDSEVERAGAVTRQDIVEQAEQIFSDANMVSIALYPRGPV